MKKYLSSLLLIVVFAGYAVYRRAVDPGSSSLVPSDAVNPPASSMPSDIVNSSSSAVATTVSSSSKVGKKKSSSSSSQGRYRNGTYTGDSADAYYGNVQVKVAIQGGQIADVQFLDYPQDRNTSVRINARAMSALRQEAITAQSAPVDIVSGATETTGAFNQSLASALAQAQ